jgi:hypothetical protein
VRGEGSIVSYVQWKGTITHRHFVSHRGPVNAVEGNQEVDPSKKLVIDFCTKVDEALSTLLGKVVEHFVYRLTAGAAIRCYKVLKRWADLEGAPVDPPPFLYVYRGTPAKMQGFKVAEEEAMYRAGVRVANQYQLPPISDLFLDGRFGRLLAGIFSDVKAPHI